jgi:hypothetical protein
MWLFVDVTAAPLKLQQWVRLTDVASKLLLCPSSQYYVTSGAGTSWLENIVALWKRISLLSEDVVFRLETFFTLCGM